MSFNTFLDKLGSDVLKVVTFGLVTAKAIQPEVDLALNLTGLAGVANLFNNVITLASGAQATANGVQGTGAQKLALVVAGVTPQFETFLQTEGVIMNTAQINAWVAAAVQLVMSIPPPAVNPTTANPTPTLVPIAAPIPAPVSQTAPVTGAAVKA